MRILTPCGHGFCMGCVRKLTPPEFASFPCPTCRESVTSVVTPFF
jgi:hypothetical protein